jgi:hypothetical protein
MAGRSSRPRFRVQGNMDPINRAYNRATDAAAGQGEGRLAEPRANLLVRTRQMIVLVQASLLQRRCLMLVVLK